MTITKVGYFYTNGIIADKSYNELITSKIRDIIKNSDIRNSAEVYLHHNDSVPLTSIARVLSSLVIKPDKTGLFLITMAAAGSIYANQKALDAKLDFYRTCLIPPSCLVGGLAFISTSNIVRFMGAFLVAGAIGTYIWTVDRCLEDWEKQNTEIGAKVCSAAKETAETIFKAHQKIEAATESTARTLADKVSQFLKEDPSRIANLVLHSHGADIGDRALELLKDYKDRIRVVTLGPKTLISQNKCSSVSNFIFEADYVSKAATLSQTAPVIKLSAGNHGVYEYLKNELVQKSLVELIV